MKNLILFVLICMYGLVQAQEGSLSTEQSLPAPKKLKASLTGYYYDFEGTQAQKNNLYSFENVTLGMQVATISYDLEPTMTVMLMGMHLDNYAETKMFGMSFKDRTAGTGDTVVSLIKTYIPSPTVFVMVDGGLSLPTGSITQKNQNNGGATNYAYNMQLGSGSYDALLGVTALSISSDYQVGGRLSTSVRTGGMNSEGYRLGNQYKLDAWLEYLTSFGLTPRLVGYYKHKGAIAGADKSLGHDDPALKDLTEFYHRDQINWDVSAAVKYTKAFSQVSLNAEAGVPVLQGSRNVDDVKVETQVYGSVGVTGTF